MLRAVVPERMLSYEMGGTPLLAITVPTIHRIYLFITPDPSSTRLDCRSHYDADLRWLMRIFSVRHARRQFKSRIITVTQCSSHWVF